MGALATRCRVAGLLAATALALSAQGASAAASAQVEVVVRLDAPSLVDYARGQRSLAGYGAGHRVLASAFGSRLYLGLLAREQADAAERIERAVPGSRVRRRYRTVLDGLSVLVRPGQLRALARVAGVAQVYPNVVYHPVDEGVPDVLRAPAVWGPELAGAGQGVKVAVIDDGIEVGHPYFAPGGLQAPAGYPKGSAAYTSGKVIVARSFAPAGSPKADRLPFDPDVSRHGTHVAGILAGDDDTTAPGELGRPEVTGLSGIAPMAWLGNYRGLSQPDPTYGAVGSTADLVAAVDAAVDDGMDVINLSIGGTEIAPQSDGLVRAVEGAVRAGVVVVAAAGNERGTLGYGSIDSPGAANDAITVAATSAARFFARASTVTASRPVPAALRQFGVAAPPSYDKAHQITGTLRRAPAGDRRLCRRVRAGSLLNAIVVVARGGCSAVRKARLAGDAGATAVLAPPADAGPPESEYDDTDVPVLIAQAPVVDQVIAFLKPGAARLVVHAITHEEPAVPGVVATFSSAGPTPFDHLLKPDVAAPGVGILSSVPGSPRGGAADWAIYDGTSMATPAVAGAAALLLQVHPTWSPAQVKAALMGTAVPAFSDEAGTREASPLAAGAGLIDIAQAVDPGVLADPPAAGFGDVADGATATIPITVSDAGNGAGSWQVRVEPVGPVPAGVSVTAAPAIEIPAGGEASLAVVASVAAGAKAHDATGIVELVQGSHTRRIPFWLRVDRPRLAAKPARLLVAGRRRAGDTKGAGDAATTYRYPTDTTSAGLPRRFDGPEQLYRFRLGAGLANAGVTVRTAAGVVAYPILLRRRDETSVAGPSGLPLNVGPLPSQTQIVPAAGLDFPPAGEWYAAVESPPGQAGRYTVTLWQDDVRPPVVRALGETVVRGRRVLRVRITDAGSGVNPGAVFLSGPGVAHRDLRFDWRTGIATIDLDRLSPGSHRLRLRVADLAETKDVLSAHASPHNTTTRILHVAVPR